MPNDALESLLRDIISRSNASPDLDVVRELLQSSSVASREAVTSAASLKKIRLILGVETGSNKVSNNTTNPTTAVKLQLRYLKPNLLTRSSHSLPPHEREIAHYKSELVLIEWRTIAKKQESQLKGRVDQLAILLGNANYRSFHSLRCIDILPKDKSYKTPDDGFVAYGLVFELPVSTRLATLHPAFSTSRLSELYQGSRRPSLNMRVSIALALSETVLQLHTTGWLHKGLRSENVIFLDEGKPTWEGVAARGPYITGYEYARPSHAET